MGNEKSKPKKNAILQGHPVKIRSPDLSTQIHEKNTLKEEESLTSNQKEVHFVQFAEKKEWIHQFLKGLREENVQLFPLDLNIDCWGIVISHLNLKDFISLSRVSKSFYFLSFQGFYFYRKLEFLLIDSKEGKRDEKLSNLSFQTPNSICWMLIHGGNHILSLSITEYTRSKSNRRDSEKMFPYLLMCNSIESLAIKMEKRLYDLWIPLSFGNHFTSLKNLHLLNVVLEEGDWSVVLKNGKLEKLNVEQYLDKPNTKIEDHPFTPSIKQLELCNTLKHLAMSKRIMLKKDSIPEFTNFKNLETIHLRFWMPKNVEWKIPPNIKFTAENPPNHAVVLYDFDATSSEEISIKEGDVIRIILKDPSGWWEAELNGKIGYVPSNYLEEKASSDVNIAVALFDYEGNGDEDFLSFKKGDTINILQKGDQWWEGELDGEIGWVPSNFLQNM
eukprot:TRINITY_DN1606_c0_g4_i1.p1 TRINITY_DN1606_c0_g4~~TRINITY_DN1606_c0_g4_i1.p1  ORF type:complete len:445 (-),score=127.67 TRINITY_DN1606_c0_g4_i1:602-1936(-)